MREKLARYLPAARPFTNLPLVGLDTTLGVNSRKKVVSTFLSTTPGFRETLSQAMAESNLRELQNLGHRFKGASQTVGGSEFSIHCKTLETVESLESAKVLKEELLRSLETLENYLRAYV